MKKCQFLLKCLVVLQVLSGVVGCGSMLKSDQIKVDVVVVAVNGCEGLGPIAYKEVVKSGLELDRAIEYIEHDENELLSMDYVEVNKNILINENKFSKKSQLCSPDGMLFITYLK